MTTQSVGLLLVVAILLFGLDLLHRQHSALLEEMDALRTAVGAANRQLDAIKDVDWRQIPKGEKVCVGSNGRVTR